jgi:hypothetical protein
LNHITAAVGGDNFTERNENRKGKTKYVLLSGRRIFQCAVRRSEKSKE